MSGGDWEDGDGDGVHRLARKMTLERNGAIERAEKAEKDCAAQLMATAKVELQRDIAVRYGEECGANYEKAQEELGKLDAHVIVLESKVAKLREALTDVLEDLECAYVVRDYTPGTARESMAFARAALKETS